MKTDRLTYRQTGRQTGGCLVMKGWCVSDTAPEEERAGGSEGRGTSPEPLPLTV